MVYLDGQLVPESDIDPGLHTFVGVLRPPVPPECRADALFCPCHATLWDTTGIFAHWLLGHFDVGQYRTLGKDGRDILPMSQSGNGSLF